MYSLPPLCANETEEKDSLPTDIRLNSGGRDAGLLLLPYLALSDILQVPFMAKGNLISTKKYTCEKN
jgi:hypothetical protein